MAAADVKTDDRLANSKEKGSRYSADNNVPPRDRFIWKNFEDGREHRRKQHDGYNKIGNGKQDVSARKDRAQVITDCRQARADHERYEHQKAQGQYETDTRDPYPDHGGQTGLCFGIPDDVQVRLDLAKCAGSGNEKGHHSDYGGESA